MVCVHMRGLLRLSGGGAYRRAWPEELEDGPSGEGAHGPDGGARHLLHQPSPGPGPG